MAVRRYVVYTNKSQHEMMDACMVLRIWPSLIFQFLEDAEEGLSTGFFGYTPS